MPAPRSLFGDPRLPERFWSKVKQTETGCWEWTGAVACRRGLSTGYAEIRIDNVRWRVHRLTYAAFVKDPGAMSVDHKCHNPACVNPAHLQAVSNQQNIENRAGANSNSKCGLRGVHQISNGRWRARVKHDGRSYHGGYFDTAEQAASAAAELRNQLMTNNLLDKEAA